MTLQDLISCEKEAIRFLKKLKEAKKRILEDDYCLISGSRETGAVKRSAIDLKNELTKLNKYT